MKKALKNIACFYIFCRSFFVTCDTCKNLFCILHDDRLWHLSASSLLVIIMCAISFSVS